MHPNMNSSLDADDKTKNSDDKKITCKTFLLLFEKLWIRPLLIYNYDRIVAKKQEDFERLLNGEMPSPGGEQREGLEVLERILQKPSAQVDRTASETRHDEPLPRKGRAPRR